MTGKNATPLIGWHSADPDLKPRLAAEAARRGITLRELLDEMAAAYLARCDLRGKEVHHKDGDRASLELSSLELRDAPKESER